jgi:hypothetical protein
MSTEPRAPLPPIRRERHDGWTPQRQLLFLEVLRRTRSVSKSARAVGMSRESAHRLRRRESNGLFALSWDRAFPPRVTPPSRAEVYEGHWRAIAAACSPEGARPRPKRAAP